jgi:hypothetical protein
MKTSYKLLLSIMLAACCTNCGKNARNQQSSNNKLSIIDSVLSINDNVVTDNNSDNDNAFKNIVSRINEIELPFDFECGVDLYISVKDYHSEILEKIAPKESGVGIIGKLPSKNGNEYIIYGIPGDIVYPYLYIYDGNGNQLDSLYLHNGYCIGDEEVISTTYTIISKDYSINMMDSIRHIHYNNENELIEDSLTIIKRQYRLNSKNLYVR